LNFALYNAFKKFWKDSGKRESGVMQLNFNLLIFIYANAALCELLCVKSDS